MVKSFINYKVEKSQYLFTILPKMSIPPLEAFTENSKL